jgi:hypothetical protein
MHGLAEPIRPNDMLAGWTTKQNFVKGYPEDSGLVTCFDPRLNYLDRDC